MRSYNSLLKNNERIIEIFQPEGLLGRLILFFSKRISLITTSSRIIHRRLSKRLDKEIGLDNISDIFADGKRLNIIKKGTRPDYYETYLTYKPYISVNWLSNPKAVAELLKSEIKIILEKQGLYSF